MKKPILLVLGLFSFASSGVFAADFTWALSGVETNDYFIIQDSGKNGFNKDVMPGSEDNVFINKSSNILLSGDKDVTVSTLAIPSVGNVTSSFIVKDGAKITVGRSATSSISLGGRDGGMGSYKTTDYSCGYLTVDGGELYVPNFKMMIGCSSGANSKSLITLEDGLIETKGADIAPWGYGEVVVNGGIFRNKSSVTVASAYSADYPARRGLFVLNDGIVTNTKLSTFKIRSTGRYIQNGGTFVINTNASGLGSIQFDFSTSTTKYGVMELRGGTFKSIDIPLFGQGSKNTSTPAALRMSIYGTMDLVSIRGLMGSAVSDGYINQQPLVEYVICNGKITPITINHPTIYNVANYSVDKLKKWIRPDGGVQLISTNKFAIFRNNRCAMRNADANTTYPNPSVWAYGNLGYSGGYNEDGCTLLEEIKIEGEIETPVPFGYIELPSVKTNKLDSAYVDMNIIPQGNTTFSMLVEEMTAAGHQVEVTDENAVRIYLPIERLGNQVTDRKVFFDFTRQDVPYHACTGVITTNALVSAVSYTPVFDLGLRIILR